MDSTHSGTDTSGGVISFEKFLEHYGIPGMKWGVRKSDGSAGSKEPKGELVLTKTFKTGDSLSIYKNPPPLIARWLSKVSPNYKTNAENFAAFSLRDKDGKKVGDAAFARKGDALDLNWIGVKPKHRGKGYASAAMNGVIKYAKKEGISKLTLEVPGKSPDARHIYEKLGFKMDGRDSLDKSSVDVWGGLYGMSYEVNKAKHEEDSSPEQWEEDFAQEFSQFLIDNFGTRGGEVEHKANFEDFLEHYGIPGMKWGVRKKQQVPASSDASRSLDIKAKAKTGKVKALTNAELRTAIERMNLEQQYKRLAVNDKPAVTRFISSTLLEIGKREVQAAAAKKVAAVVARKVATGGLG